MRVTPLPRLLISLLLAGVLLFLLAQWGGVGWRDFAVAIGRLDGASYALALLLHALIYAARSLRFALLIPLAERPAYGVALAISSAHNLASYVLPAKTGEASLIVYLKAYAGVSASSGVASLVVSRLFDLAVLCAWVAAAIAWVANDYEAVARLLPLVPLLLGGAMVLACMCLRPHWLSSLTTFFLARAGIGRRPFGQAILARLERVGAALRSTAGARTQVGCLALTVVQWAGVFAFYAVLARAAGLPESIGYAEAVFGSSLAVLFNLLPINGFAGFGTQEAGWKIGFVLLGVEPDLALATGFAVHLVQLANVVLFGVVAHLVLGLRRR